MKKFEENINTKAVDDGYGDTKFNGNGTPSHIPSFVTPFKAKPTEDFSGASRLNYVAIEIEGERYTVGDYAAKLDPNIRWDAADHKHTAPNFPILFKSALGLMCTGNEELIDLLMMNLPLNFDTPDRRAELMYAVKGTHHFKISTDGVYFVDKVITIGEVDIKKQAFGSLCDAMLDDDGEIMNVSLAKGFNVVVDIGSRTLNILTIDALEEQPSLSKQDNQGMYTPYIQIGTRLEEELKAPIPDGKLPTIIKTREIRNQNISTLVDAVFDNHASNIIGTLNKVLMNSWAFVNNVIFTGGGAEVLKPHLEKHLFGVNTIYLGRYSNVRGLRKYGIRKARKSAVKRSSSR